MPPKIREGHGNSVRVVNTVIVLRPPLGLRDRGGGGATRRFPSRWGHRTEYRSERHFCQSHELLGSVEHPFDRCSYNTS